MKLWPLRSGFTVLFVLILGIGLSGFLLVEALRSSISYSLDSQSRSLLGADLSISSTRPFSADEERIILEIIKDLPYGRTTEFFSMLANDTESRLVLVKAVDPSYPLFGKIKILPQEDKQLGAYLEAEKNLVVSPETLLQLNAKIGDQLQLGGTNFKASAEITDDPTQSFRSFALGGRIYLANKYLASTKLIREGSTATYSFLVLTNNTDINLLKAQIEKLIPAPEIRVRTAQEAGENSTQALAYLGDFLGLVSLIALLLSSLGAAYLYRTYLEKRKKEIAIYRALGVPLKKIQWLAASQALLLSLLALLPATLVAYTLLPALETMIALWSSVKFELKLHLTSFLPLILLCTVGAPLLLLPELLALKQFSPLQLFHQKEMENAKRPWLHHLPALLLFVLLAPLVARSIQNAAIFLGALAILVLVLFFILQIFSRLLNFKTKSWTTHHAFLFLARKKRAAATVFLILSIGSLLMHLLPQLEASLRAELEDPQSNLPSLFLFDIQEEQKEPLEARLAEIGHKLTSISPMVRARITAVNNKLFERTAESSSFKTREEEQETRFRNRGVNLSYRDNLQDSESIIEGVPFQNAWTQNSTELPQISLEARFADRMGLKINDILKFDIQGVEVEGKVINLRRVRWTSFQPNFFLLFQDGVLKDAPKSFLANLTAISSTEKSRIQAALAKNFPNVSVIDVAVAIKKILELLDRMRMALLLLAGLALTAGLSVLASVLSLEAQERARSLVLYRTLGASEKDLRSILFKESFIISSLAVALGAIGSIAFTFILSRFVFDGAFKVSFAPLLFLSVFLIFVGLSVSWLATRTLVSKTPTDLIRESA